jgi:hypothetical protein
MKMWKTQYLTLPTYDPLKLQCLYESRFIQKENGRIVVYYADKSHDIDVVYKSEFVEEE